MAQINEFRRLTAKDIQILLEVNDIKTAYKYLKDIKEELKIPMVLFCHFKKYFKIQN